MTALPPSPAIRGRRILGAALLTGGIAGIIALTLEGSGAPAVTAFDGIPHFDKLLHFAVHAAVTALLFWGMVLMGEPNLVANPKYVTVACMVAFLTDVLGGVVIEVVQGSHGRNADVLDLGANITGAFAAALPSVLIAARISARRQNRRDA